MIQKNHQKKIICLRTVGNDASNLPDGKNEYNVPEGSYFLMGDNRNISNDARYWNNTYVKKDKIIAKAMCVYFPFNHMHALESAEYNQKNTE